MKSPRTALFAALASAPLIAASAQAQTMSDAISVSPFQKASSAGYTAERVCNNTIADINVKTINCIEALEDAVKAIAAYHYNLAAHPENIATTMAYGVIGNEAQVRTDKAPHMGRTTLATEYFRHTSETLELDPEAGLAQAVLDTNKALAGVFTYANAGSFGLHPEAENLRQTLIGLAGAIQNAAPTPD